MPLYLFTGGLAAGTFIVAVAADFLGLRWARAGTLSRLAALTAVPILVVAGVTLTAHLGKPERGMAFPLFFTNYNSWMTRGGWVVGATAPLIVLYAALWWFDVFPRVRRTVGLVGVPLAAGLSMYTGALLGGAMFVPLWSMRHLPVLFLNSGLTTGIAAAGLVFALAWPFVRNEGETARPVLTGLGVVLVVAIGLELWELHTFMTYLASDPVANEPRGLFTGPQGARRAYEYVTAGPLAPWFWWGIVGTGLLVPVALTVPELMLRRWSTPIATTKFALVLVGGFMLRLVIVHGGDLKAPLSFPPATWPVPGFGG